MIAGNRTTTDNQRVIERTLGDSKQGQAGYTNKGKVKYIRHYKSKSVSELN